MDLKDIKTTPIWQMYESCKNFAMLRGMYSDTDKNYRMYNGNQWEGLKISGIEPVQFNIIKPIVKYKVGSINQNLWGIHFTANNIEEGAKREIAEKACNLLNQRAAKIWEHDNMDMICRRVSKHSAINDEGIVYVHYDEEEEMPRNEIISKVDIYYGNENDPEIQRQPFILIKQRLPVSTARLMAQDEGMSDVSLILGDKDVGEESGIDAKLEFDDMVTIITKLYKENGTVKFSKSTKFVIIKEETDTGLTLYPVAHFLWEEKEGSARGEGEVRGLIANQLEVNKTLLRRLITAKQTAYPQKIVNIDKIKNPESLSEVGGLIKIQGMDVTDVSKVFSNTVPSQMSPDVEKVQNELIHTTRDLAGAGDFVTGNINPEEASGRAILAVQQAAQQPLSEQIIGLKTFLEDLTRIWFDMLRNYVGNSGIIMEDEVIDEATGEKTVRQIKVSKSVLRDLQASVKIDITPKGAFDKYAQELSLENLLQTGQIRLEEYAEALDYDSVMPKAKLQKIIKKRQEAQLQIAQMNSQAQLMQQQVGQFLNSPEQQAQYAAETGQPPETAMGQPPMNPGQGIA